MIQLQQHIEGMPVARSAIWGFYLDGRLRGVQSTARDQRTLPGLPAGLLDQQASIERAAETLALDSSAHLAPTERYYDPEHDAFVGEVLDHESGHTVRLDLETRDVIEIRAPVDDAVWETTWPANIRTVNHPSCAGPGANGCFFDGDALTPTALYLNEEVGYRSRWWDWKRPCESAPSHNAAHHPEVYRVNSSSLWSEIHSSATCNTYPPVDFWDAGTGNQFLAQNWYYWLERAAGFATRPTTGTNPPGTLFEYMAPQSSYNDPVGVKLVTNGQCPTDSEGNCIWGTDCCCGSHLCYKDSLGYIVVDVGGSSTNARLPFALDLIWHEYGHYVHYAYGWNSTDYTSRTISEGFANTIALWFAIYQWHESGSGQWNVLEQERNEIIGNLDGDSPGVDMNSISRGLARQIYWNVESESMPMGHAGISWPNDPDRFVWPALDVCEDTPANEAAAHKYECGRLLTLVFWHLAMDMCLTDYQACVERWGALQDLVPWPDWENELALLTMRAYTRSIAIGNNGRDIFDFMQTVDFWLHYWYPHADDQARIRTVLDQHCLLSTSSWSCGDHDGDGIRNAADNCPQRYGTFADSYQVGIGDYCRVNWGDIAGCDVDGDGTKELIALSNETGYVHILEWDWGDPAVTANTPLQDDDRVHNQRLFDFGPSMTWAGIGCGDIEGDGGAEEIALGRNDAMNNLFVYRKWDQVASLSLGTTIGGIEVCNLDRNGGNNDIVVSLPDLNRVQVYHVDNGQIVSSGSMMRYDTGTSDYAVGDLACADIDGDGDDELLVINTDHTGPLARQVRIVKTTFGLNGPSLELMGTRYLASGSRQIAVAGGELFNSGSGPSGPREEFLLLRWHDTSEDWTRFYFETQSGGPCSVGTVCATIWNWDPLNRPNPFPTLAAGASHVDVRGIDIYRRDNSGYDWVAAFLNNPLATGDRRFFSILPDY